MPQQEPRSTRTVLALAAATTLAAAPLAPATGLGAGTQAVVVRIFAQAAHDVGHNAWVFQGSLTGGYLWVAGYAALALVWLGAAVRCRSRRLAAAALGAQAAAGLLALGCGALAQWGNSGSAPALLRLADLGSPWWSVPAALLAVGTAERRLGAVTAAVAVGYAVVLGGALLLPLPAVPSALVLAALPAIAALLPEPARRLRSAG